MLSDAVDAFLESVSERAFDEPLLAILRAQGFERVHLVGQREFGKDAIGQRDQTQWAWQSKAGDIGQGEWRALTGQLDELRLTNLGHGAFDTGIPRRIPEPAPVTTGRRRAMLPISFAITTNALVPKVSRSWNSGTGTPWSDFSRGTMTRSSEAQWTVSSSRPWVQSMPRRRPCRASSISHGVGSPGN